MSLLFYGLTKLPITIIDFSLKDNNRQDYYISKIQQNVLRKHVILVPRNIFLSRSIQCSLQLAVLFLFCFKAYLLHKPLSSYTKFKILALSYLKKNSQ